MSKNRNDTGNDPSQEAPAPDDLAQQSTSDQQRQQSPSGSSFEPSIGDDSVSAPIIINR